MPRRRKPASPFRYFNSSPEVIRLVLMMYVRFPLSLRNVEDLLFERGIDICHETVRHWWNRFGPLFAADVRRQRVSRMRGFRHWRWHLDEMYVKLNGEMVYLWRAVDQEGEILESYITKTRDTAAALVFMKKALKRHGSPVAITTDGLRSYRAAMNELGNAEKQEIGRWALVDPDRLRITHHGAGRLEGPDDVLTTVAEPHPVPPPKADALYTDPRALARLEAGVGGHGDQSTLRYYRSSPIYPNECVFFMYSDFKCMIWESMGRLPAYREWILQTDMTSVYDYHNRFLQLLQADAPGIWNLKMPSHALWLDTLIKTYPDARLVWTHRDPLRATGSFCSMLEFAERLYVGKSDKEWISFDMPDQAVEHARRAMDFSRRHPGRVIDVHYAEIMREPIETMRSLYAALGDEFTPEAEHGMRSWLADNPQGKFGAHDYNLGEFGLDAADLRGRFSDYLDRYNVEPEGF